MYEKRFQVGKRYRVTEAKARAYWKYLLDVEKLDSSVIDFTRNYVGIEFLATSENILLEGVLATIEGFTGRDYVVARDECVELRRRRMK